MKHTAAFAPLPLRFARLFLVEPEKSLIQAGFGE